MYGAWPYTPWYSTPSRSVLTPPPTTPTTPHPSRPPIYSPLPPPHCPLPPPCYPPYQVRKEHAVLHTLLIEDTIASVPLVSSK